MRYGALCACTAKYQYLNVPSSDSYAASRFPLWSASNSPANKRQGSRKKKAGSTVKTETAQKKKKKCGRGDVSTTCRRLGQRSRLGNAAEARDVYSKRTRRGTQGRAISSGRWTYCVFWGQDKRWICKVWLGSLLSSGRSRVLYEVLGMKEAARGRL